MSSPAEPDLAHTPFGIMASFGVEKEKEAGGGSRVAEGSRRASLGGAGSKYRHLFGSESPKNKTFFNLQLSPVATDGPVIACSSSHWAVPWAGGGGPVYVSSHAALGKVEPGCPLLNGHKQAVLDVGFSPFKSTLLATASLDCTTALWDVESGGSGPLLVLSSHRNSVRTVTWHPTVANLVLTSSLDQSLRLFDVESSSGGRELSSVSLESFGPDAVINNVGMSFEGALVAVACRDKVVRICDPRIPGAASIVKSSSSPTALSRSSRLVWLPNSSGASNAILTASSLGNGQRTLALWDLRGSLLEPVQQKMVDTSSGQLFPLLDESTGLCLLVGKGDTVVKAFETTFLDEAAPPSIDRASDFQTSKEPFAGVCMLPKSCCDVRQVECAKLLKLTPDSVIPLSFSVPRAEALKEYFQDDIFPPIKSSTEPGGSLEAWCSGAAPSSFSPVLDSLQPEGMIPLSQKPVDDRRGASSKVDSYREQLAKEEAEKTRRESEFKRLQDLANQHAKYNPNQSMGGVGGGGGGKDGDGEVADDEWDD